MTADQSRPVSRVSVVEALTQIRALCDGWSGDVDLADRVRAVLDAVSVDATPAQGTEIDGGRIQAVWAVFCDACNSWLPEWNRGPDEAEVILREHQDELHD